MSSYTATTAALSALQKKMGTGSANIGAASALGYKGQDTEFSTLVIGSGANATVSGVTASTRSNIYNAGTIISTGINTDIALQGDGMFVVKSSSGDIVYTRAGSFRIDQDGNYTNSAGYTMLGWALDENGNIPNNSSLSSSFSPVNLNNTSGKATATTQISLGLNLNSDQSALRGVGGIFSLTRSAINSSAGPAGIIVPDNSTNGCLNIGDSFTLQTGSATAPTTFTYGGIAISSQIGAGYQMFNASVSSQAFNIQPAPGANVLVSGSALTIAVGGGQTYTFTANSISSAEAGTFNSMDTLASAIKAVKGLTARVSGNRLFIASTDANQSLTFNDGGSGIINTLGLSNVQAAGVGANRFATFTDLRNKIRDANGAGLGAEITAAGGLSWHAASALDNLTVTGSAGGQMSSANVQVTNGLGHNFQMTVGYNDHNLKVGDIIRVVAGTAANLNAATAAGMVVDNDLYYVTGVGPDAFTISGNAVSQGAAGAGASALNPGASFTWQVVPVEAAAAPAANVINGTADGHIAVGATTFCTTTDAGEVTLNIPNHNFATGDVFSFAGLTDTLTVGNIILRPNTVYTITTAAPNVITFTPPAADIAAAANHLNLALNDGNVVFANAGDENTFYVNNFELAFKELGTNYNAQKFTAAWAASYDPNDPTKNMSSGSITTDTTNTVSSQAVTIYDSLGFPHQVMMSFAKLTSGTWAVEIYGIKNSDGSYDMTVAADRPIASGTIIFDGNGNVNQISGSIANPVAFNWLDGASSSSVTFNWGAIGGLNSDGTPGQVGVTQVNSPFNVRFLNQNGQAPGVLTSVNITSDGTVVANFSNGSTQNVFRIPVATFSNLDGLAAASGSIYLATQFSGDPLYKPGGTSGVTFVTGAVEGSNVDTTGGILDLMDTSNTYKMNTAALTTQRTTDDALLQAIR